MLEFLDSASKELEPLLSRITFVGGATLPTLVEDEKALPVRVTDDVDFIVEVASRLGYYEIEQELQRLGFSHDIFGPMCRFRKERLVVDAVPTDPTLLGFGNPWYSFAVRKPREFHLPSGRRLNVIDAPCFLATKIEAMIERGKNDLMASHDFGDIVQVLNGRPQIVEEVTASFPEVKARICSVFSTLLNHSTFELGVSCHLLPDSASQARDRLIIDRFTAISKLTGRP